MEDRMTDRDREIVDELADGFTAEERAELEAVERDIRMKSTPVAMMVNVGLSSITSPLFSEEEISAMEVRHAAAQREYRDRRSR
jgi:hypothetical protein